MSTARNLWLGFGTIAALLILSTSAILVRLRSVEAGIAGQPHELAVIEGLGAVVGRDIALLVVGTILALVTGVTIGRAVLRDEAALRQSRELLRESGGRFPLPPVDPPRPSGAVDDDSSGAGNVLVDINELRQAENAMRVSELRYRRLFETAKDGILILDAASAKVSDANPFIAELLGYSQAELVGKELWEIGLFKDIAESRAAIGLLQQRKYIRYEDIPLETKRGQRVDVEFVSNVYQAGEQTVIQCNIRDISERKRLDDELRLIASELAESDRRKSEFLAMLSHELRNPLAPIRNALEIRRLAGDDERAVTQASAMMERQIGQMVRLVDDLLDVSRISRGRIELRRGRVELASAVHHAVEAAQSLYEGARHQLTIALPPDPIYLDADPTRLAQVVGNLLNNAFKFTDSGGHVELLVGREGDDAVIRVTDDGIGLTADQLPRIFDMFTQVDTSLERSTSGLGIGLTLVKNLVEMHGGSVEAQSAGLGQGSEFAVRLPVAPAASQPAAAPPLLDRAGPPAARRVLVVDDNPDSAASLAMVLDLTGHQTWTAHDGLEALAAAESFRPEVILLDIGLPKLNGYEVCLRIRSEAWGRDVLIVALTGWGQDEDRRRSTEAGFDEHLVKPVDHATLARLLSHMGSKEKALP